jgi:hypothetical protein
VHLPDRDHAVHVGQWFGRTEHGRVWQATAICTPEDWTHPDRVAAKRLHAYHTLVEALAHDAP